MGGWGVWGAEAHDTGRSLEKELLHEEDPDESLEQPTPGRSVPRSGQDSNVEAGGGPGGGVRHGFWVSRVPQEYLGGGV